MNWEAIGAVAEVIGVAAILLSLIYVSVQIRQSNKIAQAPAGTDSSGDERFEDAIDYGEQRSRFDQPNGSVRSPPSR